jgi:hypothetical protein
MIESMGQFQNCKIEGGKRILIELAVVLETIWLSLLFIAVVNPYCCVSSNCFEETS